MVRLGFVGTGGRATSEMRRLVDIEGAEIGAFCDIVPEKCAEALATVNQALAEKGRPAISVPFFQDVHGMLGSVELAGVYVSLPPFAHGAIEHAILDARRALFVEKPVALEMTVAREIAAHAREAGVVTCVGYQTRYAAATQRARELLQGRTIGLVMANRFGRVAGTPWWRVQDRSGGMLIEQHTHAIDLLRYLAGDVQSVYAQADTRLVKDMPGLDIDDVNCATLRFASGAVGSVVNSCGMKGDLRMPGGGGTYILADGLALSLGGREASAQLADGTTEALPADRGADRLLNEAFVHALATGDRSRILSDYDDGVRSFEVTFACRLSAVQGRPVRIGEGY